MLKYKRIINYYFKLYNLYKNLFVRIVLSYLLFLSKIYERMENDNSTTLFEIDKEYTNMFVIAFDLARVAISNLSDSNINENNKKRNITPIIDHKVNDLFVDVKKKEIVNGKEIEEEFTFWFYSDKITNWMDGQKGINFSIIFDKNNVQGRIQYYRDSII